MTPLPARPAARLRGADPANRPLAVAASGAAVRAGATALTVSVIAVLLVWTTGAHSGASVIDPVRAGAWVWLYAHFGGLALPSGPLGLLPLGFTALPAALLWRAGTRVAVTYAIRDGRTATAASAALVGSYAGFATLLAVVSASGGGHVPAARALAGAALLALVAGGGGLVRAAGVAPAVPARVGPRAAAVLVAASAGVLVLVAGGALLAAVSLAGALSDAAAVHRALHPGPVGGAALFVTGLAAAPNAVVWAASYAVGPGFSLGVGTVVSPFAVSLGTAPAFPLLAALPDSGPPPLTASFVLAVPLLAAVVTGWFVQRRLAARGVRAGAAAAAAAGGIAGLLLGLAAALAGGPVGGSRLAAVGPSPWRVALAAGLELAVGAAGTVAIAHAWAARRRG
ncbi:MAG TPA: DUF6350 family protein [Mycobacteriales bacterium]|nr:DUF6350 family protein [Mycobacteriales bacterium]